MLDSKTLKCYKNLISPVEDEGLDYIWFANFLNDKIMVEYDDDRNKYSFDDAYSSRYFINEFGIFGNKQKISYDLRNGVFIRSDITHKPEQLYLYMKSDNGKIYKINNDSNNDYTDLTARKYIHADAVPGIREQTISPSIDCFAVGYKTHLSYDIEFDIACLYFIHNNDKESIKLSITPDGDFDGILYANNTGSRIRLSNGIRSEYRLMFKNKKDEDK